MLGEFEISVNSVVSVVNRVRQSAKAVATRCWARMLGSTSSCLR